MNTHRFKVCKNRGNDRIWIEGARLTAINIMPGDRFSPKLNDSVLTLDFQAAGPTNKVSGKGDRPIIDLSGKWITAFMDGAEHYTVKFKNQLSIDGSKLIEITAT